MPTVNEQLQSDAVTKAVYLQGYGNGLSDKALALLKRVEIDIERKLKTVRGPYTKTLMEAQLTQIRLLLRGHSKRLEKLLQAQLTRLARLESTGAASELKLAIKDAGATSIAASITKPNTTAIAAATLARPFQGKLLSEWIKDIEGSTARAIRDAVRIGFVEGETAEQITRRVFGTKSAKFRDGAMARQRRGMEAMIRTAIAHVSNFARTATYREFEDVMKGVKWVSTLDSRTTPICQARDGKVYPVNSGPRPPAHINCRSTTSPVAKGAKELGISDGRTRASMDGQVPSETTYADWLKTKDRGFVEGVLGKTKAKLFLDGKLSLDRFVNPRGKTYTLAELERRFPNAWKKAGLD